MRPPARGPPHSRLPPASSGDRTLHHGGFGNLHSATRTPAALAPSRPLERAHPAPASTSRAPPDPPATWLRGAAGSGKPVRPPKLIPRVRRHITISNYKARIFPTTDNRILNNSTRLGKTEQGSVCVNKGKISWFKTLSRSPVREGWSWAEVQRWRRTLICWLSVLRHEESIHCRPKELLGTQPDSGKEPEGMALADTRMAYSCGFPGTAPPPSNLTKTCWVIRLITLVKWFWYYLV